MGKVAKRDIPVKKVISKISGGPVYNLVIDGKFEPYKKGWHYIESGTPLKKKVSAIEGGVFHSYSSSRKWISSSSRYKIVDMYIPKGALYLYDPTNKEYVSDQIVYP